MRTKKIKWDTDGDKEVFEMTDFVICAGKSR